MIDSSWWGNALDNHTRDLCERHLCLFRNELPGSGCEPTWSKGPKGFRNSGNVSMWIWHLVASDSNSFICWKVLTGDVTLLAGASDACTACSGVQIHMMHFTVSSAFSWSEISRSSSLAGDFWRLTRMRCRGFRRMLQGPLWVQGSGTVNSLLAQLNPADYY